MEEMRFCMQCGKACVESSTDTGREWVCPVHGVVHREPLPAPVETAKPASPSADLQGQAVTEDGRTAGASAGDASRQEPNQGDAALVGAADPASTSGDLQGQAVTEDGRDAGETAAAAAEAKPLERVRAKFGVANILKDQYGTTVVKLYAVYKGDESSPENESFSSSTPSGMVELTITNPAAGEFFEKLGGKYVYVDFTEAPTS